MYRSSTMSVSSSVYHFVEENGRTHHRYKEGSKHDDASPSLNGLDGNADMNVQGTTSQMTR